jgi:uncharacterized membrane protein
VVRLIVLLAVALPFGVGLASVGITLLSSKSYDFPRVEIEATVRPDGSIDLVERRTFDFDGEFSFAYFTIAWPVEQIEGFAVTENDRPLDVTQEPFVGGFRGRWNFAAQDEERTFTISYRALCAVDVYTDAAHLLWQFVGTGWDEPTDHALILVHLPPKAASSFRRPAAPCPSPPDRSPARTEPLRAGEVRAWGHGPFNGRVSIRDPQTVELRVRDVPPATFVEGSILMPPEAVPDAFQQPLPQRQSILAFEGVLAEAANAARRDELVRLQVLAVRRRYLIGGLIGLPVLFGLLAYASRRRDRVPGVPGMLQEPPADRHPMELAQLWGQANGSLSAKALYRTQMLHLARTGAVDVQAEGRVSEPEDFILRLRKMPEHGLDREFAEFLFPDGRRDGSVSLKKLRPTGKRRGELREWWEEAKDLTRGGLGKVRSGGRWESTLTTALGAGGIAAGIFGADYFGTPLVLLLILISLVGMIVAHVLIRPRLAPRWREEVARWRAFRRFLKGFSSLRDAPAMAVVIWERYLVFATALGVADRVEKQVRALVPPEQLVEPWPGAPAGLHGLLWAHAFNTVPSHAAAAAAVGSSSSFSGGVGSFSSVGGFGGGFSGGGGGGGGGTGGGAG